MGTRSPVVDVAKQHLNGKEIDGPVLLSTGVRAILRPVSISLITASQSQIKDPPVPLQEVEGREHPVENPMDPDYIREKGEAERMRGEAAMDAMVLFGVELVDPVPSDDRWIKKLKLLGIDLSRYDLEDEIEREFVYKRFIVVAADDLGMISRLSGLRGEDVETARQSFQGGTQRDSD